MASLSSKAGPSWEIKHSLTASELETITLDSESDDQSITSEDGAVDHVEAEYSEHDTDSEQDEESEEDTDLSPTDGDYYLGKDKITKWNKMPQITTKTLLKHNIITNSGCKGPAAAATTPLESFFLFFDVFVLDLILENTNYVISEIRENFSRERDARFVTENEIKAFLAILIVGGVMRSSHPDFADLFSIDDIGNEFFYTTMNKKRFLFIMRCIRFDDQAAIEERLKSDKLAPIRTIFDYLVSKCSQLFTPSEYLTIDEQYVPFRGQCNFSQYIPSKVHKYGIKIFALVDARNFYNLNMEVYLGTQPEGLFKVSNSPGDIVTRLISPISKSGRNVTVNNWYTSVQLGDDLWKNHKLTLVGALKKKEKEIPREFQPNRIRPVKSTLYGFTKTMTMVSYVPKKSKSVILISTLHEDVVIDEKSQKPEQLIFYNMTKSGVDTNNKLCAAYNVGHRTSKWPMAIFFHLINVCAINAFVIYNCANSGKPLKRRDFLKKLGRELAEPCQKERKDDAHIPRKIRKMLDGYFAEETVETPPVPGPKIKKRCHICPSARSRASKITCIVCGKHICREHQRSVCCKCYGK